jgi:O-antigen/teichoic acid export membrane protein
MVNAPSGQLPLRRRVLGAGSWSLAGFAFSNAIRLGISLVMTRLLVPQMFGVMAIAMMVMTGLAMFSDVGLRQNIVQSHRGNEAAFLNTAWVIQIMRGVLLWLLGVCISAVIFGADHFGFTPKASVYSDPYLPYVTAVVSISVLISGFQSTKLSEASRHLMLARVTGIQFASQVAGLVCMIGWALIDRSIWALVAGGICSALVTTLLSHICLLGVNNRWYWDHSAFHEIIHFGKWIFVSSILGFFAINADRMLLGGYVDGATLGIYSVAYNISGTIVNVLSRIFSDVSFPALSEVTRERPGELRRSLYQFHVATCSFTYLCAGVLMVSGKPLIELLYDPRYQQAGWMLEVLAIAVLSVPFNLAQFSLLARGLPKLFTSVIAIRVAVTIVLIPLGFHLFGLPGALWAIVGSQLSSAPVTIYYQIKHGLFDLPREVLLLTTLFGGMLLGTAFNLAMG